MIFLHFLLGFYSKSNYFKVGIILCRKDNDKVPGGKFRFFFLTFLKMRTLILLISVPFLANECLSRN